jgi:hypothetical protein
MTDNTEDPIYDVGFSLADLADIDLDGIEEVRYENLPKGTYEFEITKATLTTDAKDGEARYKAEFEITVVEMLSSLEPGVDLEAQAKKTLTERFFIYPKRSEEEAGKAIGRIKAFLADTGANTSGKIGALVADSKGTQFRGRIDHKPDRTDPNTVYARLKLERAKA